MKTTIEIDDPLYRQVKARAARRSVSVRAFITEAIVDKLRQEDAAKNAEGWRAVFGKGPADEIAVIQARLDREFSEVREEDWR